MARQWGTLSPAYRRRLERGGITQAAYESGASLQKARGHAQTPEHPLKATPASHPRYFANRASLVKQVQDQKRAMHGQSPKWNEKHALLATEKHRDGTPRTVTELRRVLRALKEVDEGKDLEEIMYLEGEDLEAFFYH